MFTSHLNKPLTIDLYFIRYQPCAFLPCHLIAALIKNQVCAALGLWEKAVESHQPILINIEKRGLPSYLLILFSALSAFAVVG